jgi:hypothetical protein
VASSLIDFDDGRLYSQQPIFLEPTCVGRLSLMQRVTLIGFLLTLVDAGRGHADVLALVGAATSEAT